jgi:hypothetical protein
MNQRLVRWAIRRKLQLTRNHFGEYGIMLDGKFSPFTSTSMRTGLRVTNGKSVLRYISYCTMYDLRVLFRTDYDSTDEPSFVSNNDREAMVISYQHTIGHKDFGYFDSFGRTKSRQDISDFIED